MQSRLSAIAVLLFSTITTVRAEDAIARAVIEKAIQARGGRTELSKFNASSSKFKGYMFRQGVKLPISGEGIAQGNDQLKFSMELENRGQRSSVVGVINRDRGWWKLDDEVTESDKDDLADSLELAYQGWVCSLLPLNGEGFTLNTIGELAIEGKPAIGVRVSHKGHRDLNLFFDKDTHFLVKTEYRSKDYLTLQQVTKETFFSEFVGNAVKHPSKSRQKNDGKLVSEMEYSDVKLFEEKLDDSVFVSP